MPDFRSCNLRTGQLKPDCNIRHQSVDSHETEDFRKLHPEMRSVVNKHNREIMCLISSLTWTRFSLMFRLFQNRFIAFRRCEWLQGEHTSLVYFTYDLFYRCKLLFYMHLINLFFDLFFLQHIHTKQNKWIISKTGRSRF